MVVGGVGCLVCCARCLVCCVGRGVSYVLLLDRSWTRRLERIAAPASTSSPFSDVSARIASIESRQNEIASTLGEFAQSLNGESLNAAWRSLVAEAQKNRAATASAIEGLKAQAAANQKLVSQVGGVVQRIEKRTEERVEKAVEQVAGEAAATMREPRRLERTGRANHRGDGEAGSASALVGGRGNVPRSPAGGRGRRRVYFVKLGCTASSLFLDGVGACFGRCRRFGVPSVLLVWLFHE